MDRWFEMYPIRKGLNVHWAYWIKGGIFLRNDSAINLSPLQYREFAKPYDTKLLDYYGGGAIHYCGKGDHFVSEMASIPSLTGINLSQPHLNDMEKICSSAIPNGKKLLGLKKGACEAYAKRPDAVPGMIYGAD